MFLGYDRLMIVPVFLCWRNYGKKGATHALKGTNDCQGKLCKVFFFSEVEWKLYSGLFACFRVEEETAACKEYIVFLDKVNMTSAA